MKFAELLKETLSEKMSEDEVNLMAKFSMGDKVIVDATRFRSGRDPGRRRESYSGTIRKIGEESCVVEFDKPVTIKGKKVMSMSMKHAYLKPLTEAEPGDGAPTMSPGDKKNKGQVKDHKDGSIKEAQSGAGAPTIRPGDKQNKGRVDDKTEDGVAGTTVVGEDISDQERKNKGSIVTGKKGAKFAAAVNEAIDEA